MNVLSSLLNWIGNVIGANPNTLTTTNKTFVGSVNELNAKANDLGTKVNKIRNNGALVALVSKSLPNIYIEKATTTTVTIATPTKSGYTNLGVVDVKFDITGTTDGHNASVLTCPNCWSDTTATTSFQIRNGYTNYAKATLTAKWLFVKNIT